MAERNGIVWLASYPKSGNTWLRCLLEAYRRNGLLDINDLRISSSDGGASLVRAVSPVPLAELGFRGEMLLRPAVLMHLVARLTGSPMVKTHFANIQPDGGLPHLVPADVTKKAVYVVRDPRSVFASFCRFFAYSPDMAAEAMNRVDFRIGGAGDFATSLVSSWSNNVRSWVGEQAFPVHVVKYEDMLADAGKELTEVLEFLGEDVDEERVEKAVEAASIDRLNADEGEQGFRENASKQAFFGSGGTRWRNDVAPRWVKQIEADHGDVMTALGYL